MPAAARFIVGYVPKGSGVGAEIAYLQLGKAKTTSDDHQRGSLWCGCGHGAACP